MEEKDPSNEAMPVMMILERRRQRESELSSAEVMKILRKRAEKGAERGSEQGSRGGG